MVKFENFEDLRDTYITGKFDIFYESSDRKYKVSHLGSTIYCKDEKKCMGMGSVTNFPISNFYAIEKPEPIIEVENTNEKSDEEK